MFPPPRKYHTYCRSERDINKHTAQRRAISSAQAPLLALLSIRYSHQTMAGLFFLPPLHMFQLHSSMRERSGRRQPPAERSPVLFLEPHRVPQGIRRSTRYQVPVVRACTRLFAFVVDFVLHLGSLGNFSSQITSVLLPTRT